MFFFFGILFIPDLIGHIVESGIYVLNPFVHLIKGLSVSFLIVYGDGRVDNSVFDPLKVFPEGGEVEAVVK